MLEIGRATGAFLSDAQRTSAYCGVQLAAHDWLSHFVSDDARTESLPESGMLPQTRQLAWPYPRWITRE
ncbi:MAG: hypothetical protein R3C14_28380 [Caldilineaceae bacterium]